MVFPAGQLSCLSFRKVHETSHEPPIWRSGLWQRLFSRAHAALIVPKRQDTTWLIHRFIATAEVLPSERQA
jgi:hypothetical protein